MKRKNKKNFYIAVILLLSFVLWTVLVCFVDVRKIGPQGSSVGFGALNIFVHKLTGVNMSLYIITDWLGLVPLVFALGFAVLGLVEWICRKNIFKVDYNILLLGGFYIVTIAVYLFFEKFSVNYRPVLINDFLEVSYPSSTTMLVMCVMPTAIMQFNCRIKSVILRRCTAFLITVFIVFMVVGRLISGVHWFSDIVGGALFSAGLVLMYHSLVV